MMIASSGTLVFLLSALVLIAATAERLPSVHFEPSSFDFLVDQEKEAHLWTRANLSFGVRLVFKHADSFDVQPLMVEFSPDVTNATIKVRARAPVSLEYLEFGECTPLVESSEKCPFDLTRSFDRISVVRSAVVSFLVELVGWLYFLAWSVSFYPQILLNFKRKSVLGLNFDFLLLNIIGFSAYATYTLCMYFSPAAHAEYEAAHPRATSPVLANDVVFAVHALIACLVTGAQAVFLERGDQRVSWTCRIFAIVLVSIASGAGIWGVTIGGSLLDFVNTLSYVKMAVTCSKYFPQAYFNFLRKSTAGWSIGNVLLDFTGGSLDILQMVLQAWNWGDWTAFVGAPVKFGLGLVSIVFDVIFIFQHYVLYESRPPNGDVYEGIDNEGAQLEQARPHNHPDEVASVPTAPIIG